MLCARGAQVKYEVKYEVKYDNHMYDCARYNTMFTALLQVYIQKYSVATIVVQHSFHIVVLW